MHLTRRLNMRNFWFLSLPTDCSWNVRTGAPFPEGEATIRSFDPRTLDNRLYVGELQRILDAVCIKGVTGPDRVYVLESNPAAANAGRLRLYEGSTGRVLTDGLPNPS